MKKQLQKTVLLGCGIAALAVVATLGTKTEHVGKPAVVQAAETIDYQNNYGTTPPTTYPLPTNTPTPTTTPIPNVTVVSVKNVKPKSVRLKWHKMQDISGYEICRSRLYDGNYKCVKTIKNPKTVIYKNKKLKKKKTYYYKIRAYKIVNGEKVYGSYSNQYYVKIKK